MAMEQYLEVAVADNPLTGEAKNSLQKWKNSDDNPSRAFDCNICLDSVQDPVVTLCGHLYCWPCIYKWLHLQTISPEKQDPNQQQCPVCKAEVSDSTLIPLYGRGLTAEESRRKTPQFGMAIPKRPRGPSGNVTTIRSPSNATNNQQLLRQFHNHAHSYQPQNYYPQQDSYPALPMLSPGGMIIDAPDPVIRMFGEMVYTRVFGNSITNYYTYPNSYSLAGSTSSRIRRHVMHTDKSLGRISFFLFCCIILCLLLF